METLKQYIFLVLLIPSLAQACWPVHEKMEIEGFSELDNKLILSFKDAVDCTPITNATVFFDGQSHNTDFRGYVELPFDPFMVMMDERKPLTVKQSGYVTLNTELIIAAGTVLNRRIVLTKKLPPRDMRFVLQWGEQPRDLDLHLKGPGFHISYRNMRSSPNRAHLDHDELKGYGPETITIFGVKEDSNYQLFVDNFSNEKSFTGFENVKVYAGDELLHDISLTSSRKQANHVLDIIDGTVNVKNQSSARP
jgi:hypothetical protein